MPAHVIGHHRGEVFFRGSDPPEVAGVFVDPGVHEHLGGRFVIVRQAADPRQDVRVVGLHPLDGEPVRVLEAPELQHMDDLLKRFGAEEALGCCQPGVGQHPRAGVIGVRDHVAVFEEHLLVVSAQRHHLPGIFLLQAHDPFVDLEAIGAAVAIVAEQDELGAAVAQVYRFERRVQGRDAAMYVAHGVDHGTSWVCGFRGAQMLAGARRLHV